MGQELTSRAGAGLRVHVSGDAAGGGDLANWLLPATGRPSGSRWRGFYSPRRGARAQPAGRKAPPLSIWAHGPGGGAHCGSSPSPPPPCSPTPRPARSHPVRRGGLCPRWCSRVALCLAENSFELEASELGEQPPPRPTVVGNVMCQLVWAKGCPDSR